MSRASTRPGTAASHISRACTALSDAESEFRIEDGRIDCSAQLDTTKIIQDPGLAYELAEKALKSKQDQHDRQASKIERDMERRRVRLDKEAQRLVQKKRAQEQEVQEYLKAQIAAKKEQQQKEVETERSKQSLPSAWMAAAEDHPTNTAAFRRARAAAYRLQLDQQVQQKKKEEQTKKLQEKLWADALSKDVEADLLLSYTKT